LHLRHPDSYADGKFAPGNRSNPGGRPKRVKEIAELFRAQREELFEIAMEIIRDRDCAPTARVKALELAVAYGWGRPPERAQELGDANFHFSFNLSDIGHSETFEGEVIEDAELDEPPALPPGDQ
jgi:hypothetical protein